jgi:hypothetical protein
MISLMYMLVYFINGQNYWLGDLRAMDVGYFKRVGQIKKSLSPEELCVHEAICILDFAVEVFKI